MIMRELTANAIEHIADCQLQLRRCTCSWNDKLTVNFYANWTHLLQLVGYHCQCHNGITQALEKDYMRQRIWSDRQIIFHALRGFEVNTKNVEHDCPKWTFDNQSINYNYEKWRSKLSNKILPFIVLKERTIYWPFKILGRDSCGIPIFPILRFYWYFHCQHILFAFIWNQFVFIIRTAVRKLLLKIPI